MSRTPLALSASICHSISVLPLKSIMHLGMSDVSGSRRDPCPALRMMALLIVMEEVLAKMEARKRAKQAAAPRSEEHTSELQSLMRISYAVFCLKKKITLKNHITSY